jgi:hypothetical protein
MVSGLLYGLDSRGMLVLSIALCGGVDKTTEVFAMSKKPLRSEDEAGFMTAIWDDLTETEVLYGVRCRIEIAPSQGRGVLRITGTAWKDVGKPDERCVAEWQGQYPTAMAVKFYAAIYRACVGLGAACGRAGLPYRVKDS